MQNASSFLTSGERAQAEAAIAEAERQTSAEIVCAVSTESGRYDRAESILGLFWALVALSVVNLWGAGVDARTGAWSDSAGVALGWQALAVVVGFVAGSVAASYWHWARRLVVSAREIEEEVRRAATQVFSLAKMTSTHGRTGLLIYVSLFERRVLVLADKAVMDVLGQEGLDELRDLAIELLKKGRRAETFVRTVETAAGKLAPSLPPHEGNPDELPNELILIHPRP